MLRTRLSKGKRLVWATAPKDLTQTIICQLPYDQHNLAADAHRQCRFGPKPIFITASSGITLLDPDVSIEESIDRADKAMYAAKTAGRNRTRIWDPSITSNSLL